MLSLMRNYMQDYVYILSSVIIALYKLSGVLLLLISDASQCSSFFTASCTTCGPLWMTTGEKKALECVWYFQCTTLLIIIHSLSSFIAKKIRNDNTHTA